MKTKTKKGSKYLTPAKGYEGTLSVTRSGMVFSDARKWFSEHNQCYTHKPGRWLNPHKQPNGYLNCKTTRDGIHFDVLVHRLIAMTFLPNPKQLPQINHKDGVKTNNNVKNLEWCTKAHNTAHAHKHRLFQTGEQCHKSKLTEKQVVEIRKQAKLGVKEPVLAKKYKVSRVQIHNIIIRKNWRYVK